MSNKNNLVDLTGKKFGKLTVIGLDDRDVKHKDGGRYWKCECECGNITYVPTNYFTKSWVRICECDRE